MLQRIQTVYMLIAVLVTATFYYVLPPGYVFFDYYLWGSVLIALILFVNIFLYKKRLLQIKLNNLIILLLLVLIGLRIYEAFTSGGTPFSKKDVVWLTPAISIVFVKLANSAIWRDERLVKSVDRIR